MIIFLLTALCFSATALELPWLNRLQHAKNGEFAVLETNKTITLLAVRSISDDVVLFEEISAPSSAKCVGSWAEWLGDFAPGHTSWSMVEIDIRKKKVLECYSFTRSAWISESPQGNFLVSLLSLPLTPVPDERQKRIGPAPPPDEPDRRPLWRPSLFRDGQKVEGIAFDAFEATWPQDGSELSGKAVCAYFERKGFFPWPCWIQLDTGQFTASMRIIDAGCDLPPSPFQNLPRRAPVFLGSPTRSEDGGLSFSVKSPKYYKTFDLFAVDAATTQKEIRQVAHSIAQREGEMIRLVVKPEEVTESLTPGHKYSWLLVPSHSGAPYGELAKPFLWEPGH